MYAVEKFYALNHRSVFKYTRHKNNLPPLRNSRNLWSSSITVSWHDKSRQSKAASFVEVVYAVVLVRRSFLLNCSLRIKGLYLETLLSAGPLRFLKCLRHIKSKKIQLQWKLLRRRRMPDVYKSIQKIQLMKLKCRRNVLEWDLLSTGKRLIIIDRNPGMHAYEQLVLWTPKNVFRIGKKQ